MPWRKTKNNQPAVGTPIVTGEAGEQVWKDSDGDVVYATSAADFPNPAPQTNFMGIPATQPAEGSIHSLLQGIRSDLAAIKSRLGI